MDSLDVDIKIKREEGVRWINDIQKTNVCWINIGIKVKVNGQEMPEVFDIVEFKKAVLTSGRYPLFTCTCGVFGCGGYYVDTECT